MALLGKKKVADLGRLPLSELRKRTRILVIDDDENSFPFTILRNEGYAIDHWPRVQALGPLESGQYDIIVLDIQGVAQQYSADDGLGILEHIKQANPSQIVVAFSGHSYDLSKNRFWRLADDSLGKPVDATRCKRLIDNLIESKMTPEHYWSAVVDLLQRQGVAPKQIAKIEDKVARALAKKDCQAVSDTLKRVVDNAEIGVRVVGIACKIAALFV
ncbi:MAG: hypothetical protein IMZ62_15340 [Chloroflexi bacterium]|nr:hypothetical protein [Chloroflexota bacterium]